MRQSIPQMATKEFLALAKTRRSIRQFASAPVPRPILEDILEAASWAPSAFNEQKWLFIPTQGRLKDRAIECMAAHAEACTAELRARFSESMLQRLLSFQRTMGNAPVLIFVFVPETNANNPAATWLSHYASACAAAQNLLLAAHSNGLGACWVQSFCEVQGEVSALLGITKAILVGAVPLGYPNEKPPAPPRKLERTRWEAFDLS